MTITAGRLRDLLDYDIESGEFIWRVTRNWRTPAGSRAGNLRSDGYRRIKVDGVLIMENRAAWLWMTGEWPKHQVDHDNLDKSDNRWSNLRDATPTQNSANSPKRSTNRSGYKGVFHHRGRWEAKLHRDGHGVYLGRFDTPELAHAAYIIAATECHGNFARAA